MGLMATVENKKKALIPAVGDRVWWEDPDRSLASGMGKIIDVHWDEGDEVFADSVVSIALDSGGFAEAYIQELLEPPAHLGIN